MCAQQMSYTLPAFVGGLPSVTSSMRHQLGMHSCVASEQLPYIWSAYIMPMQRPRCMHLELRFTVVYCMTAQCLLGRTYCFMPDVTSQAGTHHQVAINFGAYLAVHNTQDFVCRGFI